MVETKEVASWPQVNVRSATPQISFSPPQAQQGRTCLNTRSPSPNHRALSPPAPPSTAKPRAARFSLHVPGAGSLVVPQVARLDSTPIQRKRFIAVPCEVVPMILKQAPCDVLPVTQQQAYAAPTMQSQHVRATCAEPCSGLPDENAQAPRQPATGFVSWQEVVLRAVESGSISFPPPDLSHLEHLPKFSPPDFNFPLPVPESPEPTPLPTGETLMSPSTNGCDKSALSGWLVRDQKFALWPQPEEGEENVSLWSGAGDEHPYEAVPKESSNWLVDIPKTSDQLALSPTSSVAASSHTTDIEVWQNAQDSAEDPSQSSALQENMNATDELCNTNATDELCVTKLVFPEVALGAVLASPVWATLGNFAPSPSDVPTPLGLSCVSTFGVVLASCSDPQGQETFPDSPEFAWFLPVPESPEPTPPTVGSIGMLFSWTPGADIQSTSYPQLVCPSSEGALSGSSVFLDAPYASTGGTGEEVVKGRPCSLGEMEEDYGKVCFGVDCDDPVEIDSHIKVAVAWNRKVS